MPKHYTLYELNHMVSEAIENALPGQYWVEAELSEAREHGGHCYMELIQKSAKNTPVAKASAVCWHMTWMLVRPHFERVTGQSLHPGMKVLLCVSPQFHENYGFKWVVTDIDPAFTLGEMAMKRQEIIRTLKEEGVFDLNKELTLPMFANRIAVISSANAAGYGDFCNQLADNEYGFVFHTELFTSIMQGESVEQSVIAALDAINRRIDDFDCVVIARGGGATSDLSGFDTLNLARNVANFPLPVITGIGHDRDESVLDMISHTRVKTPTAAAAFLISHLKQVLDRIEYAQQTIVRQVSQKMETQRLRLERMAQAIPALFAVAKTRQEGRVERLYARMAAAMQRRIDGNNHKLSLYEQRIPALVERIITNERHRVNMIAQRTQALDPQLLLDRGYSITLHQGKTVRDPSQLPPGTLIETRVQKGTIQSKTI
ncbi:MAG: exodeoxyribonuclease VII large subunit [Prevotella sp.]|nr:exodeoxyribonuclease VII large subunit [Prevotella sp.]